MRVAGEDVGLPPGGIKLEDVGRRVLVAAWEQSGGNQTLGAQLLGLTRQAFIYRLQKHEILPPYGAASKAGES